MTATTQKAEKISARQQVLTLPVGESVEFPIIQLGTIRTLVCVIKKAYKIQLVTQTTDDVIRVTCTARPEKSLEEVLNELS